VISAALAFAAEALFASDVQPSDHATRADLHAAIDATVLSYGAGGVTALVAAEYGDHPTLAVRRMRWARIAARRAVAARPGIRAVV